MTKQTLQRLVINLVCGIIFGLFSFYVFKLIPFYPQDSRIYLSLGTGLLVFLQPIAGVVLALILYVIPITYTSLTILIIFLIFLLLAAVFDTWSIGPYGFLVMAGMLVILLHPALHFLILCIPVLAGFLGPRRGSILAGVSCFYALALGVILGKSHFGLLTVAGSAGPLLRLQPEPVGRLFGTGWLVEQTQTGLVDKILFNAVFAPFGEHFVMFGQIVLWILTAVFTGLLISKVSTKRVPSHFLAVLIGMAILTAGTLGMMRFFPGDYEADLNLWLPTLVPAALLLILSPALNFIVPIMTPKRKDDSESVIQSSEDLVGTYEPGQDQKEIRRIAAAQFTRSGATKEPTTRGVFLFGPAGIEKIRLARSIADETKATLISVGRYDQSSTYYDVFVSYSTRDKVAADACVSMLESNRIRCWYAPRDIKPGEDWGKAVTTAIGLSKMVLLIFSSNSNRSQRVLDEINFAITQEMAILPFRIEDAKPSDALMLHLSSRHWLDAFAPSWKEYLDDLLRLVSNTLEEPSARKEELPKEAVDLKKRLQSFFSEAQEQKPSILFFEELCDFACAQDQDSTETISVVDTFLECMDQLATTTGILVIGATEIPEVIDKAVFEPGRLEKRFYLSPPDCAVCREILKKHLLDKPLALNVDINKLADMMEGYSLTDIEAVSAEAADLAESTRGTKQKPVNMNDLEKLIKSRKPAYSEELLVKYKTFAAEHGCGQKKPQKLKMLLQKAN